MLFNIDETTAFYIGQAVSILVAIATVVTFQFKDVKHILLGTMASNFLLAASYFFLSGFSGAWVCMLAVVQTFTMYLLDKRETSKKVRFYLLLLFCAMYIAGTVIVYKRWDDILSCACALVYVAAILQTSSKKFRLFSLINLSMWIVYDICNFAWVNIITHILGILSIITAMVRLDRNKTE